jgi:hypothetical protein
MVGAFVIPAALYFHSYWKLDDPAQKQMQAVNLCRNIAFLGPSLALFGLFAAAGHGLRFSITPPLFRL